MTAIGPYQPKPSSRTYGTVSISTVSDGLSDIINLTGLTLSAIQMSTAWTSADLAFYANVDGSTDYYQVKKEDGTLMVHVVGAQRVVIFDPAVFSGVQRMRLASVTTGSSVPVAQAAARTIKLGLSEYVKAD